MILADKIVELRKKNGWSQEELAEQLNVTRQSVSKWEGAQSIPDLERILQMSRVFGVSTDYLLRDDLGEEECGETAAVPEEGPRRRVTLKEAHAFLEAKQFTAPWVALATDLCILSPICLFLLGMQAEMGRWPEGLAAGVGLVILLAMVAAAVAIFIYCGTKTKDFLYLDDEVVETEYGVSGMVRERQKQMQGAYMRNNIIATILCILSPVPLFISLFFENEEYSVMGLCLLLALAAVGVNIFIRAGIPWESLQKLLQEDEYTTRAKRERSRLRPFVRIYWLLVTAIYLAWSLSGAAWHISWVVWPVAGVLFAAVREAILLIPLQKP